MAIRNLAARWILCALTLNVAFAAGVQAQRFADPNFRSYPVRSSKPELVEDALRRFLADRIAAGEKIEIISDAKGGRLLVSGSAEVQQLANQFIQATDRPAIGTVAQAPRKVKGYRTLTLDELQARVSALRKRYGNRQDVRIAADERLQQIVVHAPEAVHAEIAADWNRRGAPAVPPKTTRVPAVAGPPQTKQVQLRNINWQDLLRGLRSVQGPSAAVSSSEDGTLQVTLTDKQGQPSRLQINQRNGVVKITGSAAATAEWSRVIEALDVAPAAADEQQAVGRLGDTQPATITRTITVLGGAGGEGDSAWGGDVVQRMFDGRAPVRVAQGPGAQGGGGDIVVSGDAAGSFLGPVRIEFLEGTDIFIVRGQKRDVDRVMRIIEDIEKLTLDTEPVIEVLELKHANSAAVHLLINELNAGPLQARQGDISVTALVKPNALLLIGREAGVESVKKIVAKLDVPVEPATMFRVFHLKYLPAVDAERTINNLHNIQVQQQVNAGEEPQGLKIRVRAVADFRANAVIVLGSQRDIAEIADLIRQIDVEESATVSAVRVFQLKNALSDEVADVLNNTLGTDQAQQGNQQGNFGGNQGGGANGNPNTQPFSSRRALKLQMVLDNKMMESGVLTNVVVSSNARANSIVVVAPVSSMDLIAEIIRQLDELPGQEAEIRVFSIVNGDAASLVEMLNTLFDQTQQQQDGPLIQSAAGTGESTLVPLRFALDGRTNSIIATGNAKDLIVVQSILLKLDASDVNRRRMSVYELQIQQATDVATAISTFVQERRQTLEGIADDVLTQYELLDQEVVIVPEPASNKLIISATDRYYEDIIEVVKNLDRRPDMVMVQCLIAEVALNSVEEMGVEMGIQDSLLFNRSVGGVPGFNFNNQPLGNGTGLGSARDQVAGQALSHLALGRTNADLGYGGLVLSASNESVSVLLRALQQCGRLDILSRPQVMMINNALAEVQVGSSVPYITESNVTNVGISNSITFEEIGLLLSVLPRINPDGLVVLDVAAEKSQLNFENGVPVAVNDQGPVLAPSIDRTRAETIVTARDGQTVILGGLITKQRQKTERKVPYLADIPFFGRLFRSDLLDERRTELLVILTPHIVRDEADIDRVNSEEYARMSWCLGNVIEIHGEIGGGTGSMEEEVVYSQLQDRPTLPTTNEVPEAWKTFEGGEQIAPTPLPEEMPQADSEELLNAPQNASLFPGSRSQSRPADSGVRRVGHQENAAAKSKAKRSVYRFDEVPFNK